jgi:hypothetical protein
MPNLPRRNVLIGVLIGLMVAGLTAQVVNGPYTVLPRLSVQQAGSAGTPSYSWTGAPTLGFYTFDATDIGESGGIQPGADASYDLGSLSNRFRNLFMSGTLTLGAVSVGSGTALAPTINFSSATTTGFYLVSAGTVGLTGNLYSGSDATYSLGTTTGNRFNNANFAGTVVGNYLQVGSGAGTTGNIRLDSGSLAQWLTVELGDNSDWASLQAANLYTSNIRVFPVTTGGTISQPACTSGIEGTIWVTRYTSGNATTIQVCGSDAGGTYAWVTLL